MARGNPLIDRLGRRLACHQALHDHKREPRNNPNKAKPGKKRLEREAAAAAAAEKPAA